MFMMLISNCRQTSLRSGLLMEMGKGFQANHGLMGQDLGDLLQEACEQRVSDQRLPVPNHFDLIKIPGVKSRVTRNSQ